ncbi:MAG: hypothetical protein H6822_28310 [Planctomycetaceae bacterium]|nr:hypothetical protein [Planctomycetales bacterium]MCB9926085.1 hypothetical protein [Planctomycetaceae bacterium]
MDDADLRNKNVFDKLAMACRRYQQIAPNAGGPMTLGQPELLSDWLERHVCEIVAALMAHSGFRRRVRWSTERLTGEIDGDERRVVAAVENGLLRYAKALLAVADSDEMRYQLSRLDQYLGIRSRDSESDNDDEVKQSSLGLEAVEFIASRPWRDLVSWRDFFGSASQFNLKDSVPGQFGEFLPFVNKPLLVPGDFVIRCLMIRITDWKQGLDKFWVRCDTARQNGSVNVGSAWEELNEISFELNKSLQDLRALCFEGPEAQIRDSCVALLQIYAGYHQEADLSWLGPAAKMVSNVAGLPHRIRHRQDWNVPERAARARAVARCNLASIRQDWNVPERAARALIDIADLVRLQQTPEDLIEEKKRLHRLVLIEEQREGFFDGKTIDISKEVKWHGSLLWELLWELAEQALLGRNVDADCLSNIRATKRKMPPSHQAVKDRRGDLKKLIVPELNDLILDVGIGTYRLALEPREICLLVWENDEHLRVFEPQPSRSLLTLA